ncbi:MAG: peptide chain release factor 1 [Acholeplasmatales bacterium]|jgi:peptide chain release factor 1|nr:peptide chain release factor 1 [Acholeplasmatales bacterium]
MFERLEIMLDRYKKIQDLISQGSLEVKEMTLLLKELSSLEEVISIYLDYLKTSDEINNLKKMIETEESNELFIMMKEEVSLLSKKQNETEDKLRILLLPKDPNDDKNVIVSIKGATGGDEANIFAGDLFRMYSKYADIKGWKIKVLDASFGERGGYSNIDFLISGDKVYSLMKYESGVHRVQRVPETESLGRVHTSTSTVYVQYEAEDIDFDLSWDDIRVDTFCSSGPGGQSVNTTQSAVRLTHIPTGVSVASQVAKSQYENKDLAFSLLKSRIHQSIIDKKEKEEGLIRKTTVGTGERAEKIRTYNFPQNRVTDHRISLTLNRLDAIIEGKLDLIILPLVDEFQKRLIEES